MARINYPITVDKLLQICQQAKNNGLGGKYVLLSDDEEGNGYHECYFGLCDAKKTIVPGAFQDYPSDLSLKDCVTLG